MFLCVLLGNIHIFFILEVWFDGVAHQINLSLQTDRQAHEQGGASISINIFLIAINFYLDVHMHMV